MESDDKERQLSEIERERLLSILGQYAYSLPTAEWEELARSLEQFAREVAVSGYQCGRQEGVQESYQWMQEAKRSALSEGMTAQRFKKPMPEWEA